MPRSGKVIAFPVRAGFEAPGADFADARAGGRARMPKLTPVLLLLLAPLLAVGSLLSFLAVVGVFLVWLIIVSLLVVGMILFARRYFRRRVGAPGSGVRQRAAG